MSYTNGSLGDALTSARDKVSSSVAALRGAHSRPAEPTMTLEPQPQAVAPAPAAEPSAVSKNAKLKGSIETSEDIRIMGTVEGDIHAVVLTIAATGAVKGEVNAEMVVIHGAFEGRITARDVRLCAGAKVKGDITHKTLGIDTAAVFEGTIARVAEMAVAAE
ncbi:MAG TPA: polymer-forming cytoskeletal protein [Caulobacterales bacterium]|nr:polymer-forming cytoskeletal protein [Caulobacterales bacterium]